MANRLLSRVEFGAYLCYSPRGNNEVSVRSRKFCSAVKKGREETLRSIVANLAEAVDGAGLGDFLGGHATLVPAPRSSPLVEGGLWPARRICRELLDTGLGADIVPCLARAEAVPKAAFAKPGERPNAEAHYRTMAVEPEFVVTDHLTIVDDVVTRGDTLLAAVSKVQEAYPDHEVRGFALIRTRGLEPEIHEIVDPCTGTIRRRGDGSGWREP